MNGFALQKDSITKIGSIPMSDSFLVKIVVAHTGENRNRCSFSKEVLTSMIPSLSNIPILGYIAEKEENKDFTDHADRFVRNKHGKLVYKYVGHAYGVVPESNNAHFEFIVGEDGVEREYLVCYGVMWNKFKEVKDILNSDNTRPQSMELSGNYEGEKDEYEIFHFTKAEFTGLCILGEDVPPAMVSANVTKFSENFKTEYSEMLQQLNTNFSMKGELDKLEDELKGQTQEDEQQFSANTDEEELESKSDDEKEKFANKDDDDDGENEGENEEGSESDEDDEKEKFANKDEESSKNEDEDEEKSESDEDEEKEKFTVTRNFQMSHDDIRSAIYKELESQDDYGYISSVFDDHFILSTGGNTYQKVTYTKGESSISITGREEVFAIFVNAQEKQKLESERTQIESLKSELNELQSFKAGVEKVEKENMLQQYSARLNATVFKELSENLTKFSAQDLRKEIAVSLLDEDNVATQFSADSQRIKTQPSETSNFKYGSLQQYFTK